MHILIVYYSHSGNNRRFALRLADRIDAEALEVVPKGWRTFISVLLDSANDRRPQIKPLAADPTNADHVVFVAPVWDMKLANPLLTAISEWKGKIGGYSFASLCGYRREGQPEKLTQQLTELVGHPPDAVTLAFVGTLLPEADRMRPMKVSTRKVTEQELEHFAPEIEQIAARLKL